MGRVHYTNETIQQIMTPKNPLWDLFMDELMESMDEWGCDGDINATDLPHRHARTILLAMGNIDIDATIAFFEEHGGYCDCEILINVDR